MKITIKASEIPTAKNIERFIIPTILANRYAATFVFWKWMITLQWGNFNARKEE